MKKEEKKIYRDKSTGKPLRGVFVYSARLRSYWVLIPMVALLILSIEFNSRTSALYKLYPLIIFSICAIIFALVYLFRGVYISKGEIKHVGRFSDRDSAEIKEGRTLVIEICPKNRIKLRLWGNEGYDPTIAWLRPDDGIVPDICLFRSRAYGSERTAARIIDHFTEKNLDTFPLFLENEGNIEYESLKIKAKLDLNTGNKLISIRFTEDLAEFSEE